MTAGSYRYVVVGLCSVVLFLDYANRNNINNAIVSMTQDDHGNENNGSLVFHYCASSTNESAKYPKTGECGVQQKVARMGPTYDWSPTTQGVILGSFYYGYVLLQIPSGRLSELFGGKVMVTVGLTVCGFIPLITPWITQSVPWLIASRILLGMFQGVIVPAVFSINANWMSVHEKSFGFGLIGAGANLGSMVASGTTGYISQNYGWPYSFIGIGALTMIWTLTCWLCFVRSKPPDLDPVSSCTTLNIEIVCSDSAGDSTTENDLVETPPTIPWIGMLSNPAVISVGLCTFCASFGDKVIDTKLPAYLDSVLHESIDQNGMFSAYLSLSMSFTMAFGSYLSEIVISRGWLSRTNTRKTFAAVGMYGMMICIVLVPWLGIHASNILIVLVIGSFLNGFQSGGAVIVPAEMSQHFGTTIYACINMLATSSGIIAPLVIGLMLDGIPEGADLKQRWNLVFYMTAAVLFSGTTLFMIFGSSERQDFDKMETPSKKSTSGQVASKSQKW